MADGATSRSGGQLLVDGLRVHGTDRIFCVPGESFLDVLDALYDTPAISLILAKHEGAAANMAEADGKLTGRPGICLVTRGPGATHASVGVHTASHDSTPMILLVGQVPRDVRGREAFQEIEFREMFAPISKWAAEIDAADRVPEYLLRAFQVATSGRPGPVVLSLPEDMLSERSTVADTAPYRASQPAITDADLEAVDAALSSSSRPVLIVGGSAWPEESREALAAFAGSRQIPVLTSFRRQDLIDNRHECYAGHLTVGTPAHVRARLGGADLVIAIGSRLSDITTSGYTVLPRDGRQRLVHIHPDPEVLNRVYQADVAIVASAASAVNRLRELSATTRPEWRAWTTAARAEHMKWREVPRGAGTSVDLAVVMLHVAEHTPPDTIVTNGAGNFAVWTHRFFSYRAARTALGSTSGAMGYGLPAAVAAKVRHPTRTVICVAGDGDFLMYPQEVATAAQYGAAVIVLVVNNGKYATIRMHQERRFPGRVSGTDLPSPDFVGLARSLGAYAEKVETTDAFPSAFARAIAANRPAVLELVVDPHRLTPDTTLAP